MSSNPLGVRKLRLQRIPIWAVLLLCLWHGMLGISLISAAAPTIYPAPEGEARSPDYTLKVDGRPVPVYLCKVASADRELRWRAMDDKTNSASFFEMAAFAYFDADGPVQVEVTAVEPIHSAAILPSSYGLAPKVNGNQASLEVSGPYPRQLTLELNGSWRRALHIGLTRPSGRAIPSGDISMGWSLGIFALPRILFGWN